MYARRPGSADLPGGAPRTLANEHALLLGQVAARARELLAVVSRGGWPGAELAALAGYAQAEVLRHASDEETLLVPAGRSEAATRLARGHARPRGREGGPGRGGKEHPPPLRVTARVPRLDADAGQLHPVTTANAPGLQRGRLPWASMEDDMPSTLPPAREDHLRRNRHAEPG